MRRVLTIAILAASLGSAAATSAQAFGRGGGGGGSQSGDSWLNDAQRNPRFIEPYAQNDPSRYRASHPQEGWYDRQRNASGANRPYGRPYGY